MLSSQILDVKFISPQAAAIKAGCGDGIRWNIVSHEEGERAMQQLADELRTPSTR